MIARAVFAALALVACGSTSPGPVASPPDAPPETREGATAPSAPPLTADAAGAEPDSGTDAEAPDCGPAVWYPDVDGDGYGARGTAPRAVCGDTGGYAQNDLDCGDHDARMHPGQTAPQSTPATGLTSGSPWDFDCDGAAKRTLVGVGKCVVVGRTCSQNGDGWAEVEPSCGVVGRRLLECGANPGGNTCYPYGYDQAQTCL